MWAYCKTGCEMQGCIYYTGLLFIICWIHFCHWYRNYLHFRLYTCLWLYVIRSITFYADIYYIANNQSYAIIYSPNREKMVGNIINNLFLDNLSTSWINNTNYYTQCVYISIHIFKYLFYITETISQTGFKYTFFWIFLTTWSSFFFEINYVCLVLTMLLSIYLIIIPSVSDLNFIIRLLFLI